MQEPHGSDWIQSFSPYTIWFSVRYTSKYTARYKNLNKDVKLTILLWMSNCEAPGDHSMYVNQNSYYELHD